jgi:hypothetical protein
MTTVIATPQPEVKRHLALGLDFRDVQYLSSHQQPLQPPAETVHGSPNSSHCLPSAPGGHPTPHFEAIPHDHHPSTRYPPAGPLRHRRYHLGHRHPPHLAGLAMRWPLGPVFDHRALDIYRTLSILLQVAGWLAFLTCLYTLQAGKAARRYYEAEWATETNALAQRIDRALDPADGGATLPQASALPQDSPSNPAPDTINPDQMQAVLNSTGTLTNKLRALASLTNLQWRHTRGHKKHMRNGDIRSALAPVLPADLLAQLS